MALDQCFSTAGPRPVPGPRLIEKEFTGRGLTKIESHCFRGFQTRNTSAWVAQDHMASRIGMLETF
jgi:hypothetical protein